MKRFCFSVLALCLLSAMVAAQVSTGRLTGTVSGPDGVIPGATVVVRDNATQREQTITSNEEGAFSIPQLDAGTYTVAITAPGFKTFEAGDVKIDIGREYTLNPTLEVGLTTETVQVSAGADILNATDAQLSNTVSPRQVLELPLNGRNPLALVGIQPGASINRGNGSEIINGARTSSTNFTRDGINVQDVFIRNGFVPDQPTVDNTGEFTVTTLNAGVEQGFGSAQIQLSTPRGGTRYSGALFAYNRNSAFAANRFFNNAAGRFTATDTAVVQGRAREGDPRLARPYLNRNQFGGKIGGPLPVPGFGEGTPVLVRDKAFFFFSYEKFLLRQQSPATRTILRPQARNGIFSYRPTGTPAAGQCITFNNGICTVNVLTGQGLAAAIPSGTQGLGVLSLDPVIQSRILSALPTDGNRPDIGDGLNTIGLGFNQSDPEDRQEFTTRLDGNITENHALSGVFRYNRTTDARPDIDTTFNQSALANTDSPVKFFTTALTSNFSSNFVNELRGGLQFANVGFFNQVLPTDSFLLGSTNGLVTNGLVTNPQLNFRDQGRETQTYTVLDNATLLAGEHSIRFGGILQSFKVRSFNQASVGIPTYNISSVLNPNTPRLGANLFPGGISLADRNNADALRYLLGGVIGSGSIAANVTSATSGFVPGVALDRNLTYKTLAFYAGDQWRISPQFTLNYGLRYELYTPLRSTDGLYLEPVLGSDPVASVLDPNGRFNLVGTNTGNPGEFVNADKDNFSPNVSFAYTPTFKNKLLGSFFGAEGRTVLRGGFRVGYVNDEYIQSINNAVGQNAGLSATASAISGTGASATADLNARAGGVLPAPVAPPFITASQRTFADNNTAQFNRFGTVFGVDPNLQIPRTYEYNIGIQREIGFQTALEVRYVGSRSNQLVRTIDYNQIDIRSNGFGADFLRAVNNERVTRPAGGAAGTGNINGNAACLANGTCQPLTVIPNLAANGQTTVQNQITLGTPADTALTLIQNGTTGSVRFLANPNAGVVNLVQNGGRFNYNSLQVELRRRFAQGFFFQSNYTFQKNLSNVPDDGINQTRVAPFLDNANPELDYSRTPYDTAHQFNLASSYELPFGRGKRFFNQGGFVNQLLGGFQVNAILQIASGTPLSILDARGTLNRAGRSGNQTARSNLTKDEIKQLIGVRRLADGRILFIDPAVVSSTGRAANGFGSDTFNGQVFFNVDPTQTGNIERFFINGPTYFNLDASVLKNFPIGENTRLQLRAEAFNLTNTTRFFLGTNSGILNVNSTTFGRLTGTYDPRILQFAARFEF